MSPTAKTKFKMFAAYCGLFYMGALLIGWWLVAGFLPPIPPAMGAEAVAGIFRADYTQIRVGMVIVMWAAFIFIPFAALVSHYLARIEGGYGALAGSALLGGAGNMVLTFYPAMWWLVAAYRPERSPDLIYLIDDLGWLQFVGGVSMFDTLPLGIAVAAFCDQSPNPVFPRWAGFFNVLAVLLLLPDQLLFFFHSGPFAWNGLFGLWIPLGIFGLWFIVNFVLLRQAVLRDRANAI
jgi:hypothetical protein